MNVTKRTMRQIELLAGLKQLSVDGAHRALKAVRQSHAAARDNRDRRQHDVQTALQQSYSLLQSGKVLDPGLITLHGAQLDLLQARADESESTCRDWLNKEKKQVATLKKMHNEHKLTERLEERMNVEFRKTENRLQQQEIADLQVVKGGISRWK